MATVEVIQINKRFCECVQEENRYKDRGYWFVMCKNHRRANKHGYIREHAKIFEDYYKCCMLDYGVVHHINEIKTDNRIENLQGMTNKQHGSLHQKGRKHSEATKRKRSLALKGRGLGRKLPEQTRKKQSLAQLIIDMNGRMCSICGSKKTMMNKTELSGLRPWLIDKNTGLFICSNCYQLQRYHLNKKKNNKSRKESPLIVITSSITK